ncbi:MAG: hypothetical protein EAZ55_07510 [Cytophagales bacterium]|nr:MAG: hypothetical protein EAZ55_07510 [Cytophagales bacterium]
MYQPILSFIFTFLYFIGIIYSVQMIVFILKQKKEKKNGKKILKIINTNHWYMTGLILVSNLAASQ